MTYPKVVDNNCVKYHSNPSYLHVKSVNLILAMCVIWLGARIHTLVIDNNCVIEVSSKLKLLMKSYDLNTILDNC